MSSYRIVLSGELCHHGIFGQKWGVRRYQNKDGSLTEEGKKRLQLEQIKSPNAVANVNDWVKKDISAANKGVSSTISGINAAKNILSPIPDKKSEPRKRLDLSKMSDKELRDRINRELLERQYNDVFNPPKQTVNHGKEVATNVFNIAGGALAITGSALSIALAMKELGL